MIRTIAAIGDVNDINTFSGTPYHFLQGARKRNLATAGWSMDLGHLSINRFFWNLFELLSGNRPGGFQYSKTFRNKVYQQIPQEFLDSEIISFNQFMPLKNEIGRGSKLYLYIDATFKQILDRYGIRNMVGKRILKKALYWEQKNFEEAECIVGFTRWVQNSIINEYNISPEKVHTILPGANIDFKENNKAGSIVESGIPGIDRELIFGWIGKDWRRKGLEIIVDISRTLNEQGIKSSVLCVGNVPEHIRSRNNVNYLGFINKNKEINRFIQFIESCDMGCLFSSAEFSSISVLEFLRLGKPVMGYTVDGMKDLYPKDAAVTFSGNESYHYIADVLAGIIRKNSLEELSRNAQKWSSLVSWDRCIKEWECLLNGNLDRTVQLWNGLENNLSE